MFCPTRLNRTRLNLRENNLIMPPQVRSESDRSPTMVLVGLVVVSTCRSLTIVLLLMELVMVSF